MSRTASMPLIDHEGRRFSRVKDMAAYWHIYPELLSARYRSGLSIKDCLTRPCRVQKNTREKSKGCYDHLGRWFCSQVERGRWWHKDANLVRARIRGGMSLQKALTLPGRWERLREKMNRRGIFSDMDTGGSHEQRDNQQRPFRSDIPQHGGNVQTLADEILHGMVQT